MNSFLKRGSVFFLIGDLILIVFSVWLAFLIRFELQIPEEHVLNLAGMSILSLAFCIPVFYYLRLYSLSWSYVSLSDIVSLFKAVLLSFILMGAALFLLRDSVLFSGFPRSTFFISFLLVFLSTGAVRLSKRFYLQTFQPKGKLKKEKTLIVGTGDTGEQTLRGILNSVDSPYQPVGFVCDSPEKQGLSIHGFKVLGKIDNIPEIVERENVKNMVIALLSDDSQTIKRAVEKGREAGLKKIKIVPSVTAIMNGEIPVSDLKNLEVEDLLGRDPALLDFNCIENFILGKAVLVTGGAGSIGSELCYQIAKFNPKLLLILDQDETGIFNIKNKLERKFPELNLLAEVGNICDERKLDLIFQKHHPDIVFHAAAYKHVPLMEACPEEAVKNNIFGTEILADTASRYKVKKFIFISTDKAINPSSVMGASKRIGEKICQSLNGKSDTKFASVRFGNVLDSRGSVIPIFREQIKRGGPVEVTHPDMRRYFMTISEACLLVMEAGAMCQGGEVFVLDMGKPIKILDLAKEMIKLSGLEPDKDIPIVFTGIRPGEKLFEEILGSKEDVLTTESKKIFKAKLASVDSEGFKKGLLKLKNLESFEKIIIVNGLKELVSTYNPKEEK